MPAHESEKNVTVFIVARTGSTRVPKKVLREFAHGLSLFEIMCRKMRRVKYPCYAAVGDSELIEIAEKHSVSVMYRSKNEITSDGPLRLIFNFLEKCETSHALLISPCTPFLEPETINKACEFQCQTDHKSVSSATMEQNWFFDRDRNPLFPIDVYNMNSKDLCIFALANAFEIFPVDRFLKEGIFYTFSDPTDPYLYEIPKREAIDINNREEFELAVSLWRNSNYGKHF